MSVWGVGVGCVCGGDVRKVCECVLCGGGGRCVCGWAVHVCMRGVVCVCGCGVGGGCVVCVGVCVAKLRVIFGGQNIRGSAILRHFVDNIFVVAAWIVGKGRQGRFIRG